MGAFSTIPAAETNKYTVLMEDASEFVSYVGKAAPGSSPSSTKWSIMRITKTSSGQKIEWAEGKQFTLVWDNRTSYSYS